MAGRAIKPSAVAAQYDYDPGVIMDFAARILEEVNYHPQAAAVWALRVGNYDLAHDFLDLAEAHSRTGEMTPDLRAVSAKLYDRLKRLEARRPPTL